MRTEFEKEARDRFMPTPFGGVSTGNAGGRNGSGVLTPFGDSGKRPVAVLSPTPLNFGAYTPNPRSKKSSRGEDANMSMSDPDLAGGFKLGSPPPVPLLEVPSAPVEVPVSEAPGGFGGVPVPAVPSSGASGSEALPSGASGSVDGSLQQNASETF